jgi:hypothetical protein
VKFTEFYFNLEFDFDVAFVVFVMCFLSPAVPVPVSAFGYSQKRFQKCINLLLRLHYCEQNSGVEELRIFLEGRVSELTGELEGMVRVNEGLKEKMKSLSGSEGNREFADTFEEVMRDEMMAMKAAFEAKLKNAKAEYEAMTRRHQNDIYRIQHPNAPGMQNSSSAASMSSSQFKR